MNCWVMYMPFTTRPDKSPRGWYALVALLVAALAAPAQALESDRQQPLEIDADSTDGSLGDGRAELRGNVLIRQGSLLIEADVAEVEKVEGKVREVVLIGQPVQLEQEIEELGKVHAQANRIEYQVATGLVTLSGAADVDHPQYEISGEMIQYDLNAQHFQGSGGDDNGRLKIRLDPEIIGEQNPGGDSGQDEVEGD
jgi:lipopolysaccharide export system protein LptA